MFDLNNLNEATTAAETDAKKKDSAIYESVSTISDVVFANMKEMAANPANVKIVTIYGEKPVYCEAAEFFNFCEASELSFREAAQAIIEANLGEFSGHEVDDFTVVFPNEIPGYDMLGVPELGVEVNDIPSFKFIKGISKYGLKAAKTPCCCNSTECKKENDK